MVEVTRNVHFVSEAREVPLVHGDASLLRRAVNNLVDNATRAAGDDGEVVVRVGTDREEAWVEVSDDGPGFGKVSHGTGRGLAVVSQAARGHGGRVEIVSGSEPGTRVRLELPRERTPAWRPPVEGRRRARTAGQSAEPSAYGGRTRRPAQPVRALSPRRTPRTTRSSRRSRCRASCGGRCR